MNLDKMFLFAAAFNIGTGDVRATAAIWKEALADVPADLLTQAFTQAVKTWRWGNRLPMPADLLALIEDQWRERTGTRGVLRLANATFTRDAKAKSEAAEKARADQWWVDRAAARGLTVDALKAEAQTLVDNRRTRAPSNHPGDPFKALADLAARAVDKHEN